MPNVKILGPFDPFHCIKKDDRPGRIVSFEAGF
jgi:hypothetical protein